MAKIISHQPVLLRETIELLKLEPGLTVLDATLGSGGHTLAIWEKIRPTGKIIALDQDPEAIRRLKLRSNLKKEKIYPICANFVSLAGVFDFLKKKKIVKPEDGAGMVNAVLADLGISSEQISQPGRGFSFQTNGPLDMRLNQEEEGKTAAEVIKNYSQEALAEIFRKYGEERYAGRVAAAIVNFRRVKPIATTAELVEVIGRAMPAFSRRQKIHFATRIFQALRIEVNRELENLEKFLPQALEILKPKGRLAIISFHSGEDRIVKNFFRENARGSVSSKEAFIYGRGGKPKLRIITRKPVFASFQERRINPRSRSARLRVAEKL